MWFSTWITDHNKKFKESIANLNPSEIEKDITFYEMILSLLVAIISFFTTGPIVITLTVIKSPFVFLSIVYFVSKMTLNKLFDLLRILHYDTVKGKGFLLYFWFIPFILCVLSFWAFGFCIGVFVILFGVLLSIIVKVTASALWPSYIASGWIRIAG